MAADIGRRHLKTDANATSRWPEDEVATMSNALTTNLYIGGKERQTSDSIAVVDPAKPGVVVGYAAAATPQDVDDAVAAAKGAYPGWAALSPQRRAEKMLAALAGIAENRDEDAAILSQENGKIRSEAWVDSLILELRWKLALAHADDVNASNVLPPVPGAIPVETTVTYQPLGVVTIIVPFNWPLGIMGSALAAALLVGNTVIVKPPPTAPLAAARVTQRIAKQLPPGVVNVVTGPDANMSALIRNPDIAMVSFTGSVGGGKKMMELASASLTRVRLELGGNDAAIMLKDVIIDDTHLDRLFASIYDTTGQICMNVKRLFVHKSRVDEVINGLSARLQKVKLGYGLDTGTTMGPLHSPAQKAFVESLIKEAKDSGAKVLEFGELPDGDMKGGNFVRPAIVVDPDVKLRVVTEEQFGPVIPVIPFETEEDAVRMANDSWAGLCGSIWTADPKVANRVGAQLVCGYVFVNDHGVPRLDQRAPFGGMKASGFGREQGIEGIRAFQDTRAIAHLDPAALASMAP
jgi:acyl-CoA reductase-like NAD-dependent aldehyde dehydrogenase